jgi:hypothetical protein
MCIVHYKIKHLTPPPHPKPSVTYKNITYKNKDKKLKSGWYLEELEELGLTRPVVHDLDDLLDASARRQVVRPDRHLDGPGQELVRQLPEQTYH